MKKTIIAVLIALISLPATAEQIGSIYAGPVLGYHFFDDDQRLDDKAEIGARLGYFFMEDHSVEAEVDYTNTDHDKEGSQGATSVSLSGLKFFNVTSNFQPFIFLGVGGLFQDDNMASLVGGLGAKYDINDFVSFDFRVKDMYHSTGRNDIIPSIGLNYYFGKAPKPMAPKAEPAKTVVKEELAEAKVQKKEAAAVVKKDSDGDGVFDDEDQCPDTPDGYPVNAMGCTPDTDGDGVYDFEDRCPNTIKGVKVNSAGCFTARTLDVRFKTNSSEIDESYVDDIILFVKFMKDSPAINIEIQGHADSRGTDDYNMVLSEKRAKSVAKMLTEKYGIAENRISVIGYGETKPIAPNDSPENMRKNRRIDTVIR
ncbi:OmpA/MotB domain protein [Denitrovibrio acetiphilus DSM 12809]|uniref:OmpA/MotB domain protein n=1 Tax=Denitrovibrio acetiphilus (strain DSM 12809 / NBRC 114555 / N2460) TaxID=522772 RepID=D4H640_DENA2|nr:OmpA family protein [Denitrovibrio acetiphilus]ADD67686.1 OmpA/MotB domain protein [Denitrovibrio acetiphilus DSM 12809]